MILKEAYRYQNFLGKLISEAETYMMSKDFITKTKQEHLKSKANSEENDETINVLKKNSVDSFTPMQLINFIVKALEEKRKLSNAIAVAKKTTDIDIDASIAMNKCYQEFIHVLNFMSGVKHSEIETNGTGYKFNNEGTQQAYIYPIKSITEIDFDRNNVRNLIKKYQKMSDEISLKLDQIEINTEVDYENIYGWDYSDKLEDVVD